MKLPRSLTIDGRKWKVVRADPGNGDIGECDPATRTIKLHPSLEGRDLETTLAHEILHAIIPEAQLIVSEKQEELLVELMSQRLPGVVKQVWKVGNK